MEVTMNKTNVDEYVLKEILKDFSLYERIIIRIHYRIFVKFFNEIRIDFTNILSDRENIF